MMARLLNHSQKSTRKDNLETYSLVWLNTSVNKFDDHIYVQKTLRSIINHLAIFHDAQQCELFIRTVPEEDRIVLIISNELDWNMVSLVHQLRQVSSIYVYCMDKEVNGKWVKQFTKVKGVVVQFEELVMCIRSNHARRSYMKVDEPLSINIIHTSVGYGQQSTTRINGQFTYFQLLMDVLLRMKSTSEDKNELIEVCYNEYTGNPSDLNILREFEQNYSSDRALWWYTRESFLFRMMNKAFRTQNTDLLFLFRFFIRDIKQQLHQYQCSLPTRVYRGQLMSNEELKMLKDSMGQIISMNTFLSTSVNYDLALFFLGTSEGSDNNLQRVLIEIDTDPRPDNVKLFANIGSQSYFKDEDEVLIMLGSIFRLIDIRLGEDHIWIVQMTLCSDDDHDLKSIVEYKKNEYGGGSDETSIGSFANVLLEMGKLDEAERYTHRMLNELPTDHEDISCCYNLLGNITREKGDYDSSLDWFDKSLQVKMQTVKSDHPSVANSYVSIGEVHRLKGDHNQALEAYNRVLVIWKRVFDGEDSLNVAGCYNNMGLVYQEEEQYWEALECHQKTLAIRQKHLPVDHSDLGVSHNNIGIAHHRLGQSDLAIEHYNLALKIYEKSLHPQHSQIASTLNNLAIASVDTGDFQQALAYFEQTVSIYRHVFSSTHPAVIQTEQYIQLVLSELI